MEIFSGFNRRRAYWLAKKLRQLLLRQRRSLLLSDARVRMENAFSWVRTEDGMEYWERAAFRLHALASQEEEEVKYWQDAIARLERIAKKGR